MYIQRLFFCYRDHTVNWKSYPIEELELADILILIEKLRFLFYPSLFTDNLYLSVLEVYMKFMVIVNQLKILWNLEFAGSSSEFQ